MCGGRLLKPHWLVKARGELARAAVHDDDGARIIDAENAAKFSENSDDISGVKSERAG